MLILLSLDTLLLCPSRYVPYAARDVHADVPEMPGHLRYDKGNCSYSRVLSGQPCLAITYVAGCMRKGCADLDVRDGHVAGVQPPPVFLVRLQHAAHICSLCLASRTLDAPVAPLPVQAIAGDGNTCAVLLLLPRKPVLLRYLSYKSLVLFYLGYRVRCSAMQCSREGWRSLGN